MLQHVRMHAADHLARARLHAPTRLSPQVHAQAPCTVPQSALPADSRSLIAVLADFQAHPMQMVSENCSGQALLIPASTLHTAAVLTSHTHSRHCLSTSVVSWTPPSFCQCRALRACALEQPQARIGVNRSAQRGVGRGAHVQRGAALARAVQVEAGAAALDVAAERGALGAADLALEHSPAPHRVRQRLQLPVRVDEHLRAAKQWFGMQLARSCHGNMQTLA